MNELGDGDPHERTTDSFQHLIVAGVSKYRSDKLNLCYAAKDADDFEAALKKQEGKAYRKVEIKKLKDKEATLNGIVLGLPRLKVTA